MVSAGRPEGAFVLAPIAFAVAPAVAGVVAPGVPGAGAGVTDDAPEVAAPVSRPPLCPGAAPPPRVLPMSPPVQAAAATAMRAMTNHRCL